MRIRDLVGVALRSRVAVQLDQPSGVWKALVGEPLDDDDLRNVDEAAWSVVRQLEERLRLERGAHARDRQRVVRGEALHHAHRLALSPVEFAALFGPDAATAASAAATRSSPPAARRNKFAAAASSKVLDWTSHRAHSRKTAAPDGAGAPAYFAELDLLLEDDALLVRAGLHTPVSYTHLTLPTNREV